MRYLATTVVSLSFLVVLATPVFAQQEGDFRTRASGDWSAAQNWERFNGSSWAAFGTPPAGTETITILAADSIYVDAPITITGQLVNEGIAEAAENLTIGDGGVYEHNRDEGKIPLATWAEGSTLLMTGVVATAPEDRNQSYHHVTFNTPGLLANLNMDLNDATIGGDIRVIDTGLARWYLTSAVANEGATVTIMGDVIVENGAFSVQGTSNPNTTFVVHHHGNIEVTGGNFSISRGSQGLGTTTWHIYEGNFSMADATTQSSTVTPGGAKFVFEKDGTQVLTLGENIDFSALPIEVSSGTTLEMGASKLAGAGNFTVNAGATITTTLPGGVAEILEGVVAEITLQDDSGYGFNGTAAQVTSDLMPTVVSDLTINNPEGVALSQETTINGVLRLQAGVFDNTIPFTLGPSGQISYEGGSLLVGVSTEEPGELPEKFFVDQNFPNPFNPSTVIRYGLPVPSEVTVRVYNVLGQQVRSLKEGHRTAGVHETTFEARDLSSGMYIYRIEAGDFAAARQMVLLE